MHFLSSGSKFLCYTYTAFELKIKAVWNNEVLLGGHIQQRLWRGHELHDFSPKIKGLDKVSQGFYCLSPLEEVDRSTIHIHNRRPVDPVILWFVPGIREQKDNDRQLFSVSPDTASLKSSGWHHALWWGLTCTSFLPQLVCLERQCDMKEIRQWGASWTSWDLSQVTLPRFKLPIN